MVHCDAPQLWKMAQPEDSGGLPPDFWVQGARGGSSNTAHQQAAVVPMRCRYCEATVFPFLLVKLM